MGDTDFLYWYAVRVEYENNRFVVKQVETNNNSSKRDVWASGTGFILSLIHIFQPAFVTDGFQPAHQAGGLVGVLLNEIGESLIIHSKINSGVCKIPAEAVEAHEAGIDGDGAGLGGDVQVVEHATGIVPDLLLSLIHI